MSDEPWFWPALAVAVALPVALIVLGEVQATLARRGHPAARPVALLRTYVLPSAALLVLLTQVGDVDAEADGARVVATVLGFLVLLLVLSSLDVALFGTARQGSWRRRLPSIFIDLARLVLVGIGLAILFSWVWGADVGGLFTALGVTSIVIGLALQNGVGPVISGLLLLFEQPFSIGDWIEAGGVRGRVVEVNWRAVHLDTGRGVQVVPNAELAKAAFFNLSRATGPYVTTVSLSFAAADPPHEVVRVLLETADDLQVVVPGAAPRAVPLGGGSYEVALPIASPAHEGEARAALLTRLWYATRRAGLHLDGGETADLDEAATVRAAATQAAGSLRLAGEAADRLADAAVLRRYAAGETIQRPGDVPDALLLVHEGLVSMVVDGPDGARVPIERLDAGELLGLSTLTRQPAASGAVAVTETLLLAIPADLVDDLVRDRPELARDLGEALDARRRRAQLAAGRPAAQRA